MRGQVPAAQLHQCFSMLISAPDKIIYGATPGPAVLVLAGVLPRAVVVALEIRKSATTEGYERRPGSPERMG